ncbi:MAG: flavodoxin [Clostridiales bacterium]|jgi:flavodoxin|nr:flavodoxin [Clostridiales bacterium]
MNIGIIIYSHTGNTLSVGEKILNACRERGHTCSLKRITPENDDPNSKAPPRLLSAPELSDFDAVIFGAPVHAFSLCPVMKAYLTQLKQLEGKKVCCYVTQQFSKPWLGGNRAIKQMLALIKSKGADTCATGIVNWSSKIREEQITGIAEKMSRI